MKRIFLLCFILIFTSPVFAEELLPKEAFQDYKCQKEVQKLFRGTFSKTPPNWVRIVDPDFETQGFRTPTDKIGEWYELHISEKKSPVLRFFSSLKSSEWTWKKDCNLVSKKSAGLEFFKQSKEVKSESFTDRDLAGLLSEKRLALIYMWSPRMVYSVTEFSRVKALVEKRKMEFIPVLDPSVEINEARAALRKAGVEIPMRVADKDREPSSIKSYRRFNSVELFMRNATLHFPIIYVTANGKIHPRRLIGVLTNDGLNQSIDEMVGELK